MPKNPVSYKGAACTTGHGCDAVTTVLGGSPNVFIGFTDGNGNSITNPVLRVGDPLAPHTIEQVPPLLPPCINHPGQVVNTGSTSVFVNGEPIARVGDLVDIGGAITAGIPTVVAGG